MNQLGLGKLGMAYADATRVNQRLIHQSRKPPIQRKVG